jgi:hypothetical protein
MFVGYNKTSKSYWIYIPGQKKIEVSRDVRFEVELAFRRSRETTTETYGDEQDELNFEESTGPSNIGVHPLDHEDELEESVDPMDSPSDKDMRPIWIQDTLRDAKNHVAPRGTFKESRLPKRFSRYVVLMSNIIYCNPSSFEEEIG